MKISPSIASSLDLLNLEKETLEKEEFNKIVGINIT